MYHEHPLRILRYAAKNIWLLVFPLLRGTQAFTADAESICRWIRGAWMDILTIGIIILFGYVRWYFSVITHEGGELVHSEGILLKKKKFIQYSKIAGTSEERPFYLRPFRGVRIICSANSTHKASEALRLTLTETVYSEIASCMGLSNEQADSSEMKSSFPAILLFSLLFSSSFSGAVYLSALFFKGGDIFRDIITVPLSRITEETAKLADRLLLGLPSAVSAAGAFFLLTWLVSFIMNFIRHCGFTLKHSDSRITVVCGALIRRKHRINISGIYYTDLRQNLIMKFLRIYSVSVSCSGYGRDKRGVPVIIPVRRFAELPWKNEIRPGVTALWQYIWLPFLTGITIIPASYMLEKLFPVYREFSFFAVIMTEIPLLWMILVKLTALFTSGVSFSDGKIILRTCRGTSFHTLIADEERLMMLTSVQSPFQRISGKCSLSFIFSGISEQSFTLKGVMLEEVEKKSLTNC